MIPKDTDGDNKILKYKRIIRKSAIKVCLKHYNLNLKIVYFIMLNI